MSELDLLLQRWATFYSDLAQAAAALIGLLFVVITVAADRRPDDLGKIRIYITPTVVYFASVLGAALILTIPDHTRLTAAVYVSCVGVAGLVYTAVLTARHAGKEGHYYKGDAMIYAVIPFVTFALFEVGAVSILYDIHRGLALLAISMMFLLALGIRNSWAVVVDIVGARRT